MRLAVVVGVLLSVVGCLGGRGTAQLEDLTPFLAVKRVPHQRETLFGQDVLFSIETTAFKDYKVVYVANVDGDAIDSATPVEFYWLNSKKMQQKEEVGHLAKSLAFGCVVTPAALPGAYIMALNAVRSRKVLVHVDSVSGGPVATMLLSGRTVYLTSIYVHATPSWVGWTVVYVDLNGLDIETGEPVIERLD